MGKKVVLTKDEVNCPVCGITNTSLCARNPNYKGEWDEDECLVDFYFCKKCGYIEYKSKPEEPYYFGVLNKLPYMKQRFIYTAEIRQILEEVGEFWIGGKAGEWFEKNAEVYKEYLEREEGVRI